LKSFETFIEWLWSQNIVLCEFMEFSDQVYLLL
jgi:hypothetical protein